MTIQSPRTCKVCHAAENPRSQLAFHDTPEGVHCDRCYKARYFPTVGASPLRTPATDMSALVVVKCPTCVGTGRKAKTLPCPSCVGYGSVRVPANALPIFKPTSGFKPT